MEYKERNINKEYANSFHLTTKKQIYYFYIKLMLCSKIPGVIESTSLSYLKNARY